jgi:hypothetical protein
MAIGWDRYDIDRQMGQQSEQLKRMYYEQIIGAQQNRLARDYLNSQQLYTKPVPQPEPNKVLLLLGEEA